MDFLLTSIMLINFLLRFGISLKKIVFIGLGLPKLGNEIEFAENLDKLVVGFKSTILVRNAESTDGGLIA